MYFFHAVLKVGCISFPRTFLTQVTFIHKENSSLLYPRQRAGRSDSRVGHDITRISTYYWIQCLFYDAGAANMAMQRNDEMATGRRKWN